MKTHRAELFEKYSRSLVIPNCLGMIAVLNYLDFFHGNISYQIIWERLPWWIVWIYFVETFHTKLFGKDCSAELFGFIPWKHSIQHYSGKIAVLNYLNFFHGIISIKLFGKDFRAELFWIYSVPNGYGKIAVLNYLDFFYGNIPYQIVWERLPCWIILDFFHGNIPCQIVSERLQCWIIWISSMKPCHAKLFGKDCRAELFRFLPWKHAVLNYLGKIIVPNCFFSHRNMLCWITAGLDSKPPP